jgi:hypothetical protein
LAVLASWLSCSLCRQHSWWPQRWTFWAVNGTLLEGLTGHEPKSLAGALPTVRSC